MIILAEKFIKMKIIGLTGGIGAGKTAVARLIEKAGYPVYYSDDRAKEIVTDDEALREKIKVVLGEEAYDEEGNYNRKYVAEQVFNDAKLLEELNGVIHPAVKRDFEKWVGEQVADFGFKETALLFELGLDKSCYKSLLVTAEECIRMKRVMDRDGKTYREVEKIMQKQMPEKEKIERADLIIYNNGNLETLEKEVENTLKKLN